MSASGNLGSQWNWLLTSTGASGVFDFTNLNNSGLILLLMSGD